ncbi:MAG TPA: amino acid adenylation domain-containing protein [Jatrophihabitans sp.]|jgi:amino acid adenylation domain-containing protein|uniref:amino acid adenylation domain-containing protein n=1 Tax=Jatrophihabitans sp. TaxID=1932789 RepID=UPI002F112DF5
MPHPDICDVISSWTAAAPDAPAVLSDDPLTRAELEDRAHQVAGLLRAAGVGPDDVVGVLLPRGSELIAALLGVLRSGAAYLLLDVAGASPGRLAGLAETARARWVLTDAARRPIAEAIAGATVLEVGLHQRGPAGQPSPEPAAPSPSHPEDLAYVVFTSGSTGVPKPVAVPRRALFHHAAALARCYGLTERDRVLQFANPAFDVFAEEVFPTLAAGAAVVVLPDSLPTPAELERQLRQSQVSVVNLPTSYWTQWTRDLDARPRQLPPSLRLVVIGSEAGYAATLARWQAHSATPVINAYGLSETTVTATTARFDPTTGAVADPLPIGHPIDGVVVCVLDDRMRPLAAGEPGELYIGGALLARGYLGRADQTAERFVPDPAHPGARLYRTGDLVRQLPDGLRFLGRDDGQLKIRGHRVEPLEVVAALTRHLDVLQAHVEGVTGGDAGDSRLVAYLVPRDDRRVPTAASISRHARAHLPAYMVPSAFAILDALPCLPNGKVNRAALPTVQATRRSDDACYLEPRTDLERRLAAIWRDILGLDRVGMTEDLFSLGGHSLTATRIAARIQAEEEVAVSPVEVLSTPTIEQLAALVTRRGEETRAPLPPVLPGARHRAPLSRQQEQVWLHTSLAPGSIAYHTQTTIRVVGPLDLEIFDRAISELARRHAILRTTYVQQDGGLWQLIQESAPAHATRVDLRDVPVADRVAAAEDLIQQELHRQFDLGSLPLLRWTAIRLAEDEHELVLVEHHMVHDGWSFALLMRELKALYNAYARSEPSPLAETSVQYHDYATWQLEQLARMGPDPAEPAVAELAAPVFATQLAYWRKQLEGMPAPLTLHPDRPRPHVQTYRGQTLRIELPPQLPAALRAFCQAQRLTLFSTMYAAFAALLHRYTGEQDVCIGSAYANRQIPGTQDVVGMFVNAVVQRCEVSPDLAFGDLARRAQEVVFEAAQHQELPFVELVRALNPQRDAAVQPMAPILFSVNDSPLPELDLAGATGTIFERGNGSAKTELDVVVIPRAESQTADAGQVDDRILLLWEYNADLFDERTMREMAARYLRLLESVVTAPTTTVGDLPLLSAADRQRESQPARPARPFRAVTRAVLDRAAAAPDALAVSSSAEQLRYGELVRRASRLATRLRRSGVRGGDVVALLLPRGPGLVVAELAVLLAGAAFLPLDRSTPAERIALCCAEAGVRWALTDGQWAGELPATVATMAVPHAGEPDGAAADLMAELPAVAPSDTAYVIYTSGSSGVPKGVAIPHAALANLVSWYTDVLDLSASDRTTLFASPAFDVSIGEIWPTLAAGASLHVPEDEVRLVPTRVRDWLAEHRITVVDLPTTLVESLLALAEPPGALRLLLTGGDRLTASSRPDTPYTVINAYGPTEATVTSTWAEVGSGPELPGIGRPLPGLSAHVLDDGMRPAPTGIPGELYLGGIGLALGYLNRADLTAERFVPDPFSEGQRLYRTGDLVRRADDGSLDFLGRTDSQIKLRGHRIEPGEVVAALRRLPGIEQAHVAAVGMASGTPQLVAYLVRAPEPAPPTPADLRQQLGTILPAYMVPSSYVWLDELPMTRSGKIDVRRLPQPRPDAEPRSRPAIGATEGKLAEIWRDILALDRVGAEDNFFDLGGHSLLLGRIHQRITTELSPDLPLIALFQYPTIGALARYLDGTPAGEPAAAGSVPAARSDGRGRLRRQRARR